MQNSILRYYEKLRKDFSENKAYSLIEVSVVLLVIAILIGGIFISISVFNYLRLISARTQTDSSPVPSIKDLTMWLETTSEKSFNTNDAIDGAKVKIWYDLNPQPPIAKSNATCQNYYTSRTCSLVRPPVYKSSVINGLPMVAYASSVAGNFARLDLLNNPIPVNHDYTIFVVFMQTDGATVGTGAIIGTSWGDASRNILLPESGNRISIIRNGIDSLTTSFNSIKSYKVMCATVVYNKTLGQRIYINNSLNVSSSNVSNTGTPTTMYLGYSDFTQGYSGYLGEVIIYARDLNSEERNNVYSYLSKKWSIAD